MEMQPPSFDDFIKRECTRSVIEKERPIEQLALITCPTPGCGTHALLPIYEDGALSGFSCANGCEFSVRRNVFTGEIMYFKLERLPNSPESRDLCGMKFSVLGEPYTDWY
jgi:hypothetical protein